MIKTRIGALAAAFTLLPATAWAQPEEPPAEPPAEGAGAEVPDVEAPEIPGGEGPEAAGGDTGGLGSICEIDPAACPKLDFDKEAARDIKEEIYSVQQIFVLRVRRVELQPYWAITLNDQFVGHPGPGLAFNYWITNVLAVGLNGNYYEPFNTISTFNAEVRRAGRVGIPLTEYNWGAALNFTYVPAFGKFAGFGDFIFQYDAYVVGGVGALQTRPIAVIDPDNRNFDWQTNIAFNAGIGLRILFNRWFAAVLEVRDYVFNDKLENTEIDAANPQDKETWFGESRLTNGVQAQMGVSVFIPFSFDYRLPK